MPNTNFSLTLEEINLLKDVYDDISFQSIRRGNEYFKKGYVLSVNKQGDLLEAKISGTAIYSTLIDLEKGHFQCSCPARPPCKHVAALIIWALQNENTIKAKEEETVNSVHNEKDKIKGHCELVLMIKNEHACFFAKKENGTFLQLKKKADFNYLNTKWREIADKLLSNRHSQGDYYFINNNAIAIPITKVTNELESTQYPTFYNQNDFSSPVVFGGTIECRTLLLELPDEDYEIDLDIDLEIANHDGIYRSLLYCRDPFTDGYQEISMHHILYSGLPLFLNEKPIEAKIFKKMNDMLFEEHRHSSFGLTKRAINKSKGGESCFYFCKLVKDQRKDIIIQLINNLFSVSELYSNKKTLEPYYSMKMKKLFDEAWTKGPALAISLYFDETEEKKKIKGKVEFIYAQKIKYLKPKQNIAEEEKAFTDHLVGFPGSRSRKKYERKFVDNSHKGTLVVRSPRKESNLLEIANIPFSYRKTSGEFAFTTRFLKKFATEYLPIFKKKNILLKLDKSLMSAVMNLHTVTFNIESSSKIDWFQGQIKIKGLNSKDTKLILSAYRKKEGAVQLSTGQWFVVDQLNINDIYKTLENIGIRINKDGVSSDFNRGQLIGLEPTNEIEIRAEKKIETLKTDFRKSLHAERSLPLKLSTSLEKQLRTYQKEGVAFFWHLFNLKVGGILADDMGLGKTIQTIAFIESIIRLNPQKSLFLVVCPMAALSVWELECQKFSPEILIQIWHGLQRKSKTLLKKGVVITTYMTLAQDIDALKEIKFTSIFIDEAQNIKNVTTKGSKSVRELNSDSFFCLTGTPVENYLSDLWSLMDICFPGLLGTKQAFGKTYGLGQALTNHEQLIKKIDPFILRRRKKEVLQELPQKSETLISLPLDNSQTIIYEKVRKEAVQVLKNAGSSYLMKMLPYLMQLRRICCHPDLKDQMKNPEIFTSSKLTYLESKIPEMRESSSGVLIFSQFTDVLKKVAQLFEKKDIQYFYLDGSTTANKRKEIVAKFQNGEKEFFLISLKAGGTALTLHRADTVFHLDPWWNPASEHQATDRVHRIGQKRNVFVYKLIAKDTIEEKVINLQKKKQQLFDSLFDKQKSSGQVITRDELMSLLEPS